MKDHNTSSVLCFPAFLCLANYLSMYVSRISTVNDITRQPTVSINHFGVNLVNCFWTYTVVIASSFVREFLTLQN